MQILVILGKRDLRPHAPKILNGQEIACWCGWDERWRPQVSIGKGFGFRGKHQERDTSSERKTMDHHREHPAKDVQPEDGFDEGQRDTPRDLDDEAEPRFSRGQEEKGVTPEKLRHEDFARGQDSDLPTPEKEKEGRFSEGQEERPHRDV
jgi:hypothetical protein